VATTDDTWWWRAGRREDAVYTVLSAMELAGVCLEVCSDTSELTRDVRHTAQQQLRTRRHRCRCEGGASERAMGCPTGVWNICSRCSAAVRP
jgi:hypothetical protein